MAAELELEPRWLELEPKWLRPTLPPGWDPTEARRFANYSESLIEALLVFQEPCGSQKICKVSKRWPDKLAEYNEENTCLPTTKYMHLPRIGSGRVELLATQSTSLDTAWSFSRSRALSWPRRRASRDAEHFPGHSVELLAMQSIFPSPGMELLAIQRLATTWSFSRSRGLL